MSVTLSNFKEVQEVAKLSKDYLESICRDNKTSFIMWDGVSKNKQNGKVFNIVCEACLVDDNLAVIEAMSEGKFKITKGHFKAGKKGCGCSMGRALVLGKLNIDDYLGKAFTTPYGNTLTLKEIDYSAKDKRYIVECDVCSLIPEVYPYGSFTTNITDIRRGRSACACGGTYNPLDKKYYTNRVKYLCKGLKYTFLGFVGGSYEDYTSKLKLLCTQNHITNSTCYDSFLNQGIRCGSCSVGGYSCGLTGSFYIQNIEDFCIKIGITNKTSEQRMAQHSSKSIYHHKLIYSETFEDGYIPYHIEKFIKDIYPRGVVSKENMRDGFSETIDIKYLEDILTIVKNY